MEYPNDGKYPAGDIQEVCALMYINYKWSEDSTDVVLCVSQKSGSE